MGQKVHPRGIRLGISADWRANWYAAKPKAYAVKVRIDLLARAYLEKELKSAGISDIFIAFSTKGSVLSVETVTQESANITAHVARPGMVIGKKGDVVERMKKELELIMSMPVYLNIQEVRNPELNAKLIAENIATQLVRRVNHRRAMKRAEDMAMKMGALGIKVIISGRLGGTEIARTETDKRGSIPLHTFSKPIDYAQATAQTASGKVGIAVYVHTTLNEKKSAGDHFNRVDSRARRAHTDRGRAFQSSSKRFPRNKSLTREQSK